MKDFPSMNQRLRELFGQIVPMYYSVQNKNKKNLFFIFFSLVQNLQCLEVYFLKMINSVLKVLRIIWIRISSWNPQIVTCMQKTGTSLIFTRYVCKYFFQFFSQFALIPDTIHSNYLWSRSIKYVVRYKHSDWEWELCDGNYRRT